ncbi:MAG TPA: DnaJ domain-containing protein [Nocardioides sp.]|uniref:DnaJ domain-containing protein n=1 Tax=Nocardioides sp. TaxID=35761 RepID=UPI002F402D2F
MPDSRPSDPSLRVARDLLGVSADADRGQLGRAFRRHARRLHPDISLEPDATERFVALQAAYRLALDAAEHDSPDDTRAASGTSAATGVAHRDQIVVLDTTLAGGVHAARSCGPRQVAWLVAGPVQVRPLDRASGAGPITPGEP